MERLSRIQRARLAMITLCFALVAQGLCADQLASQYLCAAERASGFHYEKAEKEWVSKLFKTNSKWVVRKAKDGKTMEVAKLGGEGAEYFCDERTGISPLLFCHGFGEFTFNPKNGRFIASGPHAYLLPNLFDSKEGDDDEWNEIGLCSPF